MPNILPPLEQGTIQHFPDAVLLIGEGSVGREIQVNCATRTAVDEAQRVAALEHQHVLQAGGRRDALQRNELGEPLASLVRRYAPAATPALQILQAQRVKTVFHLLFL
jgi:hypothetical protein